MFINKTLRLNDLKVRTAMNAKILVFVICVEAIICHKKVWRYGTFKPHIFIDNTGADFLAD